uniref:Abnormal cell migration protein 18-like fibronectin type I domain-containing protein n=1 Tax=Ditylenchus dipsaci TaxID=166011 RepID=A0A915CTS3_9BILA
MGMLQLCILHLLVIAVVYCSSIAKQEGSKSTTCNHNGKDYKDGEEWTVRDAFVLRCNIKPNGFLYEEVVACLLSDGTHLALDGTQKQEGQNVWTCTKNSKGSGATKEWKMIGNETAKTSPTVTNTSPAVKNTSKTPTSAQSSWKGPSVDNKLQEVTGKRSHLN